MVFRNYELEDFLGRMSFEDRELFEERAGIIEFEGEMDRDRAEIKAQQEYLVSKIRLKREKV